MLVQIYRKFLCFWIKKISSIFPSDFANSTELLSQFHPLICRRIPNGTWSPVSSDSIEYLRITNVGFKMERGLYEDRMRFVDTLPLLTNRYNVRHEKTELWGKNKDLSSALEIVRRSSGNQDEVDSNPSQCTICYHPLRDLTTQLIIEL